MKRLVSVKDCVWRVTHGVHVFLLQVLVHILWTLALRARVISNSCNSGGLVRIIAEIWNHPFYVIVSPAAGSLISGWMMNEKIRVCYPVQCGFKHVGGGGETDRKCFFCSLPYFSRSWNLDHNCCSFPSSQNLELCYIYLSHDYFHLCCIESTKWKRKCALRSEVFTVVCI
jgi:hypothetical protein